ncbi:hypothetical protein GCM10010415_54580 [Streptomyces atrovirens]|uniref:SAV_2336 N-terminal domain-related protein n=1 Tax=Streptomyces atrovirens TaxID=285556 RepID=A0ABW0DMJ4_9ACTN
MSSGVAGSGEPDGLRVAHLYAALCGAGVELSPRELSDALWLALHTPPSPAGAGTAESAPVPRPAPASVPRPEPREPDAGRAAPGASRRPVHAFTRARGGGAPGAPLRIPGVRGLRHPLGVVRGLRALKRRVPSPHRQELDETATAEAIADSGVLDAVLRPARDRWLHLLLAVDDGPSLRVWRDTVGELADALTGSGIFRSVRVSPLDASALLTGDPTAVLAVTDGVADHWYDGSAHRRLAALARRAPTAVLHLLPTRLWNGTGLAAEPAIVRTTGPAPPNSLLAMYELPLPDDSGPRPGLPVPVLELEELSLRPWADLIASHGGMAALRVIDAESPPGPDGDGCAGITAGTATDRVRTFRATASPSAYELAGHLAAVDPLTLPVMRLVQAAALPDSNPVCLAEVMLSGLLHVDAPLNGHDVFAFAPEVRGVLRTVVRAGSAQRTVDAVSDFIVPRLGRTPDFPAVIADRTGTLSLPRGGNPLAELASTGEPYGGGGPGDGGRGTEPLPRGTHNLPERRTVRWVPDLQRDVDWVEETLAGQSGSRAAALCGPAGSDKTTVALEYAHRHLRDHTLVWWIDAREPGGVESGVAGITHALFPESASGPAGTDATDRALRWLESHPGWLLVLDHVTDPGKVTELQGRVGAYGHLLVTARTYARQWAALPVRDLTSAHRGRHDPLTGLRDEPTLRAQLSGLLCADPGADDGGPDHAHLRAPSEDPDTEQRGLAVVLCSLDGLKNVNDRFGRAAGDAVLVEMARRLRDAVRDDDTVARVGGDVFAVLTGGLDRSGATNLAVRLRGEVLPPIRVDGQAVRVGASTAVVWAQCGSAPERIIDSARGEILARARGLSLLLRLTEVLCALTCMKEARGRALFARVLADQLGRPIHLRGLRQREDVVALVRAALAVAGGENLLVAAVRIFEGDAPGREVQRLFDETGGPPPDVSRTETGGPGRAQDSLALVADLVTALCELTCTQGVEERAQFAALLGDLLGRPVEVLGVRQREDVVALVHAALSTAGGGHTLADVVRILEGVPAADEVARRITAAPDPPVPRMLSAPEEDGARALLRAATAELPAARLRDVLVHDLSGLRLPVGLSPEQLFAYTLELTAQPDGLPPAVLLVECAARLAPSPEHRSALAAWTGTWAANAGLSEALRRRRAAANRA